MLPFQSPCGDYTLIRRRNVPAQDISIMGIVSFPLRGLYPYKMLILNGIITGYLSMSFSPLAGIIPL